MIHLALHDTAIISLFANYLCSTLSGRV